MRQIDATELAVTCLDVLEEVQQSGESVAVLRAGKEIARVVPMPEEPDTEYPQLTLRGKGRSRGNLFSALEPEVSESGSA